MGVYSHDNSSLINMSGSADENISEYSGMGLENVQNEQMIFDAVIGNDFTEVSLEKANVYSEIHTLQETYKKLV